MAESDAYANLVLPKAIRSHRLDHRDAGFATELTYGTLRHQGTYDAILRRCVDRPPREGRRDHPDCAAHGRAPAAEHARSAHAALNQSVSLAREKIGAGPASFINAVLRRVSERTPEEWYELIIEEAKDDTERMAPARLAPGLDCAFHAPGAGRARPPRLRNRAAARGR